MHQPIAVTYMKPNVYACTKLIKDSLAHQQDLIPMLAGIKYMHKR